MVTQVYENMQFVRRLSCNEFAGCKNATSAPLKPINHRRISCHNPLTPAVKNQQQQPNQQEITLKQQYKSMRHVIEPIVNIKSALSEEDLLREKSQQNDTPLQVKDLSISKSIRDYIEDRAKLVQCQSIHICDGSEQERQWLLDMMAEKKIITPLKKRKNCWLARTDPRDVARVESKTFICTRDKHDVICRGATKEGALGNWMHIEELDAKMSKLLQGCMAGRTMYVIPFSMGPIGSKLSKVGIQLTDSPYVVSSMMIMTRVSRQIFDIIQSGGGEDVYVRCIHSVGCPLPLKRPLVNNWPCNPEETIIAHVPERREIISYGSGYGGNSLLGKKCFALRLGSIMGKQEGWLAEHMLILAITNPAGQKRYIAAAFPSACGKTNLAMMTPTLPGYKIECVGDDIAWMRFDDKGVLRAINPEAGFFGVAPGTNYSSNPNAMKTIEKNTIFTNVAETSDGDFYWEGLEDSLKEEMEKNWSNNEDADEKLTVIDWQDRVLEPETLLSKSGTKSAHPNSRFCCPASQCPIMDEAWESAEGVPISAIIFGGRRPEGVPLVYEARDWAHGVFMGASMRSESTAAAEHTGKTIMHDPFAMRPFFGYNFGSYLQHWLSFGAPEKALNLPKIFHVNWFRQSAESGQFLWPGFGENSRVLDWIFRRCENEQGSARETPIGYLPDGPNAINLDGLDKQTVDLEKLFEISKSFWLKEQATIHDYLEQNVGLDLPDEIREQSKQFRERLLNFDSDN